MYMYSGHPNPQAQTQIQSYHLFEPVMCSSAHNSVRGECGCQIKVLYVRRLHRTDQPPGYSTLPLKETITQEKMKNTSILKGLFRSDSNISLV